MDQSFSFVNVTALSLLAGVLYWIAERILRPAVEAQTASIQKIAEVHAQCSLGHGMTLVEIKGKLAGNEDKIIRIEGRVIEIDEKIDGLAEAIPNHFQKYLTPRFQAPE